MSEGILKFNLPEERGDFELASNATKWYLTVWDMDQYLRNIQKYNEEVDADGKPLYDDKTVDVIREQLWEFIKDRNLSFDENW